MFSFFRRNPKKDAGVGVGSEVQSNGVGALKESNKRPSVSDTCVATPKPTCAENSRLDAAPGGRTGQHTADNVAKENTIMAPMAAFRGKGKGKRKTPDTNATTALHNSTTSNAAENHATPAVEQPPQSAPRLKLIHQQSREEKIQSSQQPPQPLQPQQQLREQRSLLREVKPLRDERKSSFELHQPVVQLGLKSLQSDQKLLQKDLQEVKSSVQPQSGQKPSLLPQKDEKGLQSEQKPNEQPKQEQKSSVLQQGSKSLQSDQKSLQPEQKSLQQDQQFQKEQKSSVQPQSGHKPLFLISKEQRSLQSDQKTLQQDQQIQKEQKSSVQLQQDQQLQKDQRSLQQDQHLPKDQKSPLQSPGQRLLHSDQKTTPQQPQQQDQKSSVQLPQGSKSLQSDQKTLQQNQPDQSTVRPQPSQKPSFLAQKEQKTLSDQKTALQQQKDLQSDQNQESMQSDKKTDQQLQSNQKSSSLKQGQKPSPEGGKVQVERRQPMSSYATILRRLDSIPPMSPAPEPEKRRNSVKPCSHVTIAASPRPAPPPAPPSPPADSPVAATRSSRLAKSRTQNPEADTVTAAIRLRIDLSPTEAKKSSDAKINSSSDDKVSVNNANEQLKSAPVASATVVGVTTVNGKQDTDCDNEKRNLVNQETQFQTQLADLTERLRVRDAEVNELRTQMENLQRDAYVKSSTVDRLQAELTAAYKDSEFLRQKLKHLQEEVEQYRQKNAEMVEELQKKKDEYKALEETSKERTSQLETSVRDLTEKLSTFETQLTSIREERDRLEQRRATLEAEREEEKKIVQEALDAAATENETMRRRWEQDFERLRTVNTDREQQMLDDFEWKLREVQAACKRRLDEKERLAEQKIKDAQKDVDVKVKKAEQQMNEVLHLKSYEAEVTQLRGLTNDQHHSLRTMSTRVEELQTAEEALREEISRLHEAVESEKREQATIVRKHEKDLADKERALQIRLDKQRGEVAVQWEQKLRQECARLTAELEQMHSDEKQLAVELVRIQKDQEYDSVKEQWERKVKQHLSEISELKSTLSKKEEKHKIELERLQTNTDRDIMELRRELDKAEMAFHERTEKLLEEHEKELDRLNEEAERRLKELEQNCQMQVSSMRATLELVKEQAARETEERIQRLEEDHHRAQEELLQRLSEEKDQEIERIQQEFKSKFDKLKEQFMVVQKNHQSKEGDLLTAIENLQGEMTEKSSLIDCLQSNVDTLHGGVQVLRQEIVNQDQTLHKVKADAEQKIGELQHALKVERDTLQVEREEHIEEITHIQKQNQAAMDQLQRRCQCLTKLFEDMRSRYDRRESRSEDLNLISDLQAVIAEQEKALTMLNEEKRFIQLELMKRNGDHEPTPPLNEHMWKGGGPQLPDSVKSKSIDTVKNKSKPTDSTNVSVKSKSTEAVKTSVKSKPVEQINTSVKSKSIEAVNGGVTDQLPG